jgi:magnesium transporter
MLLELKFSIGTLGLGSGAFVAALYGMNLKNFMENSDIGFWGVTGGTGVIVCLVCAYGLTKLRKVQRISMWGESGRKGPNWRYTDAQIGSNLDQWRREKLEWQRRVKEERLQQAQERANQALVTFAGRGRR